MKRNIYRVQWRGLMWVVKATGQGRWPPYLRQVDAIAAAIREARGLLSRGVLSQVVLHGKNGRIRWERTYGRDPRRTKG